MELKSFANAATGCVAISIDEKYNDFDDLATVVSDEKVDFLWCGPDAWNENGARAWGVQRVPVCYVVNRSRKVLFVGHPIVERDTLMSVLNGRNENAVDCVEAECVEDGWMARSDEAKSVFFDNFQETIRGLEGCEELKLRVECANRKTVFVLEKRMKCSDEEFNLVHSHLVTILQSTIGVELRIE